MIQRYIDVIKDIYNGSVTITRKTSEENSEFSIIVGLDRGSTLSSYLFSLIMDKLTREIQDEVSRDMLFVDNTVLINETNAGINARLKLWTETLKTKGF